MLLQLACAGDQKLRTPEDEPPAPLLASSEQEERQIELTRNWSFGVENYKNQRYGDVPHFFWRVIEMDSAKTYVDVYSFLANTYLHLSRPDSAQLVYERGLGAFPQNPYLHRGLAELFAAHGRRVEALAHYRSIAEFEALSEEDYRSMAELQLAAGDTAQAIDALDKLQELAPDDLAVRAKLSSLYQASDHRATTAAPGNFDVELQQRAQQPRQLLVLGKACYRAGEYDNAILALLRYLELSPTDDYGREYLADAYLALKRFPEAAFEFDRIIAKNPQHVPVLVRRGQCARELHDWGGARRFVHQALAVEDTSAMASLALGEIYEAAARYCLQESRQPAGFSDRLVFKLAYQQYEKAASDPQWQRAARLHMSAIESLLPRPEDYFNHQSQDRPEGGCYGWIYQ